MKHYELTSETRINNHGVRLYRIIATVDFFNKRIIKKGNFGGWIDKTSELFDGAWIENESEVFDSSKLFNCANISEKSIIKNSIIDNTCIKSSEIYRSAIYDLSIIINSRISDSRVNNSNVNYSCVVNSAFYESSICRTIIKDSLVEDSTISFDGISHNRVINYKLNRALINSYADFCSFNGFGSNNRVTTAYKTNNGCTIKCGCFTGNIHEFKDRIIESHGDNKYAKEYLAMIELIKIKLNVY